ncbi:MAG: peptidase, partial [Cyclobacteriaceae bacterium]|nr:peptidase [Cyclobacteriaceae bacterium]
MKNNYLLVALALFFFGCSPSQKEDSVQEEAQAFINTYTDQFKTLYYESAEAEWAANTKIIPGDTVNSHHVEVANEAYARFTGSEENISKA